MKGVISMQCTTATVPQRNNLPATAERLLRAEYGQARSRITLRSANGVYAVYIHPYSDTSYEVGLYHWQDSPVDEAAELTCIERYEIEGYKQAYGLFGRLLMKEYDRGLAGYSLVKPESEVVRASKYMGRVA